MYKLIKNKNSKFNNKGFTLIELIVILAVLSIILSIAAPTYKQYVKFTKGNVCSINRKLLMKMYHTNLAMENNEHTILNLEKYIQEQGQDICPEQGEISLVDEIIQCDIHSNDEQNLNQDENDEGEVPFL